MAQAKPIPDGYHSVIPQLVFNDASKAIAFYKKAFGAKELDRMPGPGGKIWHAELEIGDSKFFLMDAMPGTPVSPPTSDRPSPSSVMLYVTNVDQTFKAALAAGAKEIMAVQDTFWGDRGGSLIDPFGYPWFLATHVRDMTAEEQRRAGQEVLRKMESEQARHA